MKINQLMKKLVIAGIVAAMGVTALGCSSTGTKSGSGSDAGSVSTLDKDELVILMDYVPKEERVITIEDSAELQISNIINLVKLEARNATADGENQVTIRDLIKSALRMRPDRIIVGEVRGAESVDMIQAIICTI